MDKFIVSARKYRPQNFSTVVGQSHITTTLKNAIKNNQLAHAFLFCGPMGVGKTTCARILGKTINCENPDPRCAVAVNRETLLNHPVRHLLLNTFGFGGKNASPSSSEFDFFYGW